MKWYVKCVNRNAVQMSEMKARIVIAVSPRCSSRGRGESVPDELADLAAGFIARSHSMLKAMLKVKCHEADRNEPLGATVPLHEVF